MNQLANKDKNYGSIDDLNSILFVWLPRRLDEDEAIGYGLFSVYITRKSSPSKLTLLLDISSFFSRVVSFGLWPLEVCGRFVS